MALTLQHLATLINQQKTFVIEFYAPWCGPCKVYGPKLHELCNSLKIPLFTINGDEVNNLHELYNFMMSNKIAAYPTTLVYVKGSLKGTVVGADLTKIKNLLS
jgi:thioredoxin 1